MREWLDPTKWTQVPFEDEMKGPLAIGFLIVFALGFVVAAALYIRPPEAIRNHPVKRRVFGQFENWLMWAFGFGLVFYAFQLMGLPFLGWRVWTWISIAVVVAVVAYIIYYWQTSYKSQLAAYEAQRQRRAYQQQSKKRPIGENGQPVPRSPRAEKRRQRTGGSATRGR
jgi:small-conductance mechanosensitive channel